MGDGIQKFEDLNVWQLARHQVVAFYRLFDSEPIGKDFGLKGQLTRAAVSVMSNIAEGFERLNLKEKSHFYNIARASNGEVRSLLYVVADVYPAHAESAAQVQEGTVSTGKLISGLIRTTAQRMSPSPGEQTE
jgi:four helix bundle protein